MILLAATLMLAPVQSTPLTAGEVGRAAFEAGFCEAFGFELIDAQAGALLEVLLVQRPDLTPEQFGAEARVEVDALKADLTARFEAATTRADIGRWLDGVETRCDALAQAHPSLLKRTPATAREIAAARAQMSERFAE